MIAPSQWSLIRFQQIRYGWTGTIRPGDVKSVLRCPTLSLGSQAAARAHLMRLCEESCVCGPCPLKATDLGFLGHVIFVCPTFLGEEVDCSMHMSLVICQVFNYMLQNG